MHSYSKHRNVLSMQHNVRLSYGCLCLMVHFCIRLHATILIVLFFLFSVFFLCILFSFFHFIMMCVCVFFLLSTIECWSLTCSYAYCGFIPRTVKPERCMISFVYFICLCFCFRLLYAVKIRLTSTEMAPYRSKWIPSKNISNEQKELWI